VKQWLRMRLASQTTRSLAGGSVMGCGDTATVGDRVALTPQRKLTGALERVGVNGQIHLPRDTALWVLCWYCKGRDKSVFIRVHLCPMFLARPGARCPAGLVRGKVHGPQAKPNG